MENYISKLREELENLNGKNYFKILDSLENKYQLKVEYDRVIGNTENAFIKVYY